MATWNNEYRRKSCRRSQQCLLNGNLMLEDGIHDHSYQKSRTRHILLWIRHPVCFFLVSTKWLTISWNENHLDLRMEEKSFTLKEKNKVLSFPVPLYKSCLASTMLNNRVFSFMKWIENSESREAKSKSLLRNRVIVINICKFWKMWNFSHVNVHLIPSIWNHSKQ